MKKIVIGDVFSCKVPTGYGYIQYVHEMIPESPFCCSDYIRILPGIYAVEPDLANLVQCKETLTVMFPIKRLFRKGACCFVGNYNLPMGYALPRYGADFQLRHTERHNGRLIGSWAICDYFPDEEARKRVQIPLRFHGIDDISIVPERYSTTLTNLSPDPYMLFYWIAVGANLTRAECMSCSKATLERFVSSMEHRLDSCY